MRGREGKIGWEWAGQSRNPPPPLDPSPALFRPLPFKVLGRNSPAPPGERGVGGLGWSELLGEET